jgi:hypothetical protein
MLTLFMEQQKSTNDIWRDNDVRSLVIRVNGRQLERASLSRPNGLCGPAAQAGQGAEIVDDETGQVIERHPPQTTAANQLFHPG